MEARRGEKKKRTDTFAQRVVEGEGGRRGRSGKKMFDAWEGGLEKIVQKGAPSSKKKLSKGAQIRVSSEAARQVISGLRAPVTEGRAKNEMSKKGERPLEGGG